MIKKLLLLIATAVLLSACSESDPVMKDIRKQGKLIVLTRNAPTTYYLDANDRPAGFEYDLSKALADSLNVDVEYKLYDNIEEIMAAINKGEGHIVAAGLTQTDSRALNQNFGPGYKTVQQQVVCHRKVNMPKEVSDLLGRSLLIIAESSYQESLLELKVNYPELKWEATSDLSTEQVLEKVENREVDCTVIDSNIMSLNRRYYPNLMVAFPLSEEQELAWMLPIDVGYFKQYVEDWFAQIEQNSTLNIINERYYGYVDIFDFYNNHVYLKRITSRLPKYKAAFKAVAKQYQLPWTLLAAQSYQESGWNAAARSPTGVRGLMMLTQNTAKAMGVAQRTDPMQSIKGGAKYLDKMLKRIPEDVANADRVWFALAAYNVGFAHLLDARALARQLGKSPSTWHDLKEVLPLLSQKKYYKNLKYGYARGAEPVKYIDRIRYYQDVLVNTLSREG
ncbi:membrane-bound lytic murein transglycosylase MltF [methanotrophic endosymbiont of Bathymodiolus puteoserpentis (Logatchev)]|jgi:membrane-bound lytic murein transglycosylase F|uniref:membrane-bound lytic murein transglycosylase MltF n=1 Tax=methanotrophic endosymbiont of Bathymodiolus puteoserpentis (Logatchev) TaxID=343235 RepID=UPI0013CBF6B9|nr:membrane-bound lytic murein transglycosylase MltF [methanotrophic endosymbiont of Bathymodiolus puteoserpentis (Logatchev)]SHE19237.1 Transglycosylase, Slt family [methanotrophic endosymbiont of Bathymodiolus puteoserpentis (Logatchev)]